MKDIYLSTNEFADRPIIQLNEFDGLTALLDSGARFPVWTADVELLESHGAKLFQRGVSYSGIGGPTIGDVYKIPHLILGTKTHGLIFPELPVVTNGQLSDAPFDLLLSNTMFHDLEYTVGNKRHFIMVHLDDEDSDVVNAVVQLDDGYQVLFTGAV